MADMWGEGYSDGYGQYTTEDGDLEIQDENTPQGTWERYEADGESVDEWEDIIEVDDWSSVAANVSLHSNNDVTDSSKSEAEVEAEATMETDDDHPPTALPSTPPPIPSTHSTSSPSDSQSQSQSQSPSQIDIAAKKAKDLLMEEDDSSPWQRFAILPHTPIDHAFYSSKPAQTSKSFISRLNKEYRVLKNSLPGIFSFLFFLCTIIGAGLQTVDSILVRAYEDRADLLRSLIIGPENTPYENAVRI